MVQLRNGGWIPVTRQWRSGGAQSKEGKNDFFTVFVDNIPSVMDAKALYKLFTKFGIVKDAYIPFKRRKVTNSRFGFVRCDSRISTSVAIQKSNGLFVDDMMLVVKMATYDRNNRSEQSKRKSQDTKRSMDTTNIKGSAAYVGHRSFAKVLKGDTSVLDGNSNITIKVNEESNGWLYDSAIVRFNTGFTTHSTMKALKEIGLEQVEVRKGGGRDIILSFKSTNELQLNIGKIREWFKGWSQFVMVWKPNLHLQQERCVWLSCYGIPLHLWNRNTLNSIGKVWGTILSLDGDIYHPKSFSHTRIRVATACMELINKTIFLECKGISYSILVCEDHLADSGGLKISGMEDSNFTEASNSEEVRNTPEAAVRDKNDGDEVAQMRALLGTDLVYTNGIEQRKESSCSHIGEEIGTVVEETVCVGGSIRTEEACVEGTLMEGSEQNLKNNDSRLRCVQQAPSSGKSKDGCGPGINLDVILAKELIEGLGPGINLEVNLAHVPNRSLASGSSNRAVESGHMALLQSAGHSNKHAKLGLSNLHQTAQVKFLIPYPEPLQTERKKGKKKAHIEGFNSFARFHGFRTAAAHKNSSKFVIFRLAASTFAQSDLSESGSSSTNSLLEEAKATIQLGKSLGVNYNGEDDAVLNKIIDLELKDKARINNAVFG
ncbi:hypothetical protein ACSBR1_003997 [Camellia fascicularis]